MVDPRDRCCGRGSRCWCKSGDRRTVSRRGRDDDNFSFLKGHVLRQSRNIELAIGHAFVHKVNHGIGKLNGRFLQFSTNLTASVASVNIASFCYGSIIHEDSVRCLHDQTIASILDRSSFALFRKDVVQTGLEQSHGIGLIVARKKVFSQAVVHFICQ